LNTVQIVRIKAALVLSTVILASTVFLALPVWAKDSRQTRLTPWIQAHSGLHQRTPCPTETFNIKQGPNGSIVTSVFKSAQGEQQAGQLGTTARPQSISGATVEELSPEKPCGCDPQRHLPH
jgi:hypothetical protein